MCVYKDVYVHLRVSVSVCRIWKVHLLEYPSVSAQMLSSGYVLLMTK